MDNIWISNLRVKIIDVFNPLLSFYLFDRIFEMVNCGNSNNRKL